MSNKNLKLLHIVNIESDRMLVFNAEKRNERSTKTNANVRTFAFAVCLVFVRRCISNFTNSGEIFE